MLVFVSSIQSGHDLGHRRGRTGKMNDTVGDAVNVGETKNDSGPHNSTLYPLSPLSLAQLRCRQDDYETRRLGWVPPWGTRIGVVVDPI